jgi:hypothetical protein
MYTDPSGMWWLDDAQQAWNNTNRSVQQGWNKTGQIIQQGWNTAGRVIADNATSFRNTVTSNAQTALESWANVAVQGQKEGGIVGGAKQISGSVLGLLSSLATEDNIDKTNETLAFIFGGEIVAGFRWIKSVAAIPLVKTVTPFVKSGLAAIGVYQGGGQVSQAWTGVGENGRQLSVPERVTVGITGLATIGASILSLRNPPKTECFVAGTEIQTLDGTKNIEDIHVGDWVLSDDPNTVGEIEYKQVLQTFVKDTTNLVDIYIDGEKITTTEEHPFWVPDVGWVAAKDLHAGSLLQTKYESWLDVDRVEKHSDTATVYNFEVEGFHTYFVSDLGLLVHNTCKTVFNSSIRDTYYSNSKAPTGANTYPVSDLLAPSADPYRVHHSSFGDYNNATTKQIVDARTAHKDRFGNLKDFNPSDVMGLRLNGGGHGQENINHLIANRIDFNILHTFENGVRTGNVPRHVSPGKREGVSQSWFPASWGRSEIEEAGKHVANLHGMDNYKHGTTLFADYNGVRVGILVNDLQPSRIGTIFPDSGYQPPINYPRLLEVNPHK